MPRVIRVGDVDDDPSHVGDPGPNAMIENDATMWLDEGASNAGNASVDVASLLGYSSIDLPEAEIARVYEQVQADQAAGRRIDANEYLEGTGATATGAPLPASLGTIQEPPPGADGAHPDWNTFPVNETDDELYWTMPADRTRVDPAIATIARRMARALGTRITVNSAYRDRSYNASIGGASNSKHMYGKAMDLAYIGGSAEERQRMLTAAIEAGAQGIGLYNSFMHIDLGPKRTWNRPQPSWAAATMSAAGYA
jgi:hypothetical protein